MIFLRDNELRTKMVQICYQQVQLNDNHRLLDKEEFDIVLKVKEYFSGRYLQDHIYGIRKLPKHWHIYLPFQANSPESNYDLCGVDE